MLEPIAQHHVLIAVAAIIVGPLICMLVYLFVTIRKRALRKLIHDEKELMHRIARLQRQQIALERWIANYAREKDSIS